jgi:hypothetical protein
MMPLEQPHQADSDSNQSSLLLSKLRPPRPASALIERPALLSLLKRALECTLTLLSAPAGFGNILTGAYEVLSRVCIAQGDLTGLNKRYAN